MSRPENTDRIYEAARERWPDIYRVLVNIDVEVRRRFTAGEETREQLADLLEPSSAILAGLEALLNYEAVQRLGPGEPGQAIIFDAEGVPHWVTP